MMIVVTIATTTIEKIEMMIEVVRDGRMMIGIITTTTTTTIGETETMTEIEIEIMTDTEVTGIEITTTTTRETGMIKWKIGREDSMIDSNR
jgi:hypothetical protein